MARIVVVRHGQTEWNREERFRGLLEVPLNETGVWQAEQIASTVRSRYRVSAVYTATVSRAVRTAEAIGAASGVDTRLLPALDLSFGDWEGRSVREVAQESPELFHLWKNAPHRLFIPHGESFLKVRRRVSAAAERLAEQHGDETIVMVSQGTVCRILALYFLGLPNSAYLRLDMVAGCINLFEKRPTGWTTLLLSDTSHLQR